jgi:hypothetical protein
LVFIKLSQNKNIIILDKIIIIIYYYSKGGVNGVDFLKRRCAKGKTRVRFPAPPPKKYYRLGNLLKRGLP